MKYTIDDMIKELKAAIKAQRELQIELYLQGMGINADQCAVLTRGYTQCLNLAYRVKQGTDKKTIKPKIDKRGLIIEKKK